jgi:hypothetical protein
MMAAAAALLAVPAMAQDGAAENLVLPGATLAPDCGNLYGLAGRAFCVSAPLVGIGGSTGLSNLKKGHEVDPGFGGD